MPTRRNFIGAVTGVAAAVAGCQAAVVAAPPTPAPAKSPVPASTSPSPLAIELARSLQRGLPNAHLSAAMTAKIAKDINDNLFIANAFRKLRSVALPPPDFVFVASAADRP